MPPRRPVAPPPVNHAALRGRGAVLGLAVGDALAVPAMGRPLLAPPFPQLASGRFEEMRGGGEHSLRRGQVTANTHMACALAWSLREQKKFDVGDVARRYMLSKAHVVGLDEQTREVLQEMEDSTPVARLTAGRRVWQRHHRKLYGNACLARTALLGVALYKDRQARTEAALENAALTHYDMRCQLASAVLAGAVACALNAGPDLKAQDMVVAATSGLRAASARLGRMAGDYVQEILFAAELVKADLEAAQKDDPELYGLELHVHRHAENVRVAFRLAWWELLHAPSFQAGVVDAINRGGDTCANASLAGVLLGALHGEPAIPPLWRQAVLEAPLSTATPSPQAQLYHPRHLLALAPELSQG